MPVRMRFSALILTGPGAHSASCRMDIEVFTGVKRPGREVKYPPPSSAEVEERIELCLYSPSRASLPVLGRILSLPSLSCFTAFFYIIS